MAQCAVISCNNRSGKDLAEGVTFHKFPRDPLVKKVWIDATGNGSDWTPDRHQLCSEHFEDKCFHQLKKSRRLFVWAIPTLKIKTKSAPAKKQKVAASERKEAEKPADPDGETPEINKEIEKRKRLDEVFVKPLCSKCKRRAALNVSNTMLEGQAKSIVAKVYHFLSEEFRDIKDKYGDSLDLTRLSQFRERTAFACGVSKRAVGLVLKEEQEWLDTRPSPVEVEEPPKKKRMEGEVQAEEGANDINSSDEVLSREKHFEGEQNIAEDEQIIPEVDAVENPEEIELLEGQNSEVTQEESQNIDNMDVNENYHQNNEVMESVSVEFEFHNIEPTSNQSEQIQSQIGVEPTIITMINQPVIEREVQPPIPEIENQPQICMDPNIIAVIDSVNQSSETVCGIEPRIIRMVDSIDPTFIENQGQMCAMEPAIITMIDQPNQSSEVETPRISSFLESQFHVEPTIIFAREMPEIVDTCTDICCQEQATLTMISGPTSIIDEKQLDRLEEHADISMTTPPSPNPSVENELENENGFDNDLEDQIDNNIENDIDNDIDDDIDNGIENDIDNDIENDIDNDIDDDIENRIDNDLEQELDNNIDNDFEHELENNMDNNIDNDLEHELENNMDNNIDNDFEHELDNNMDNNIDNDLEHELENNMDNNIDSDLEHELENNMDNNIDNDLEHELENNMDNNIDSDLEHELENNMDNNFDNDLEHELENNMDNNIDNDFEHELDNNMDNNIDNDLEHELENNMDNNIDSDLEHELENNMDNNIDNDLEHELENNMDNNIDNDLEHELENNMDNNIDNDLEHELENNIDNDIDNEIENYMDDVIENGNEDEDEQFDDSAVGFVETGCQTDRDTETPLYIRAEQVFCNVDAMSAISLATSAAQGHIEAQAVVAEPQYFAGNADAENLMNVQRVDYADGLGYFVILN